MITTPFLQGTTLLLRPLLLSDLDGGYVHWLNDPDVCEHNSHHVFPYTRAQAEKYITDSARDERNMVFAIVAKDTSKHIGNIALQRIDTISRHAEYAILIGDKDYWGKGVAKEASHLMIRHGFDALNLHRIHCGTSSANTGMQRLAAALGMTQEGVRRQAHFKNGSYADIIEYGLLRHEYRHDS